MELKSYQKEVIVDLARYLELVVELQSPAKAYQALWNEKNVMVGLGGMPNYVNVLPGVPHVCAKVPTGGGKTYIAASSLRTIFDAMPQRRAKAVVWLVPSEAILTQTRKALENSDHPYRQRRDVGFDIPLLPFPYRRILLFLQILISSMATQNPPVLLPPKSVCQPLSARTADGEASSFPTSAGSKGITH